MAKIRQSPGLETICFGTANDVTPAGCLSWPLIDLYHCHLMTRRICRVLVWVQKQSQYEIACKEWTAWQSVISGQRVALNISLLALSPCEPRYGCQS